MFEAFAHPEGVPLYVFAAVKRLKMAKWRGTHTPCC